MELEELARRAVACHGWKWLPGMLGWRTTHDGRQVRVRFVECVEDQELVDPRVHERKPSMTPIVQWGFATVAGWSEVSTILPDLRDPATLGCLLLLVREAWGDSEAHLALGAAGWVLMSGESRVADVAYPSLAGKTEAEALVYALEKAPCLT